MSRKVLFICTQNSVRSIMAETILNDLSHGSVQAFSAGAKPSGTVNPLTLETLKAHRHQVDEARSKSLDEFIRLDFDMVITVCDNARQSCPTWPGKTVMEHWSIDDPAAFQGSDDERRAFFERIYREIDERIRDLLRKRLRQDVSG